MNSNKHIILVLISFLSAVIQISILNVLSGSPLILIPILYSTFLFFFLALRHALFYSAIVALLLDMYSPLPFGSYLALILLILLLLAFLTRTILPTKQPIISKVAIVILSSFAYILGLKVIEHIQLRVFESIDHTLFTGDFIGRLILTLFTQSILTIVVVRIIERRHRFSLRPYLIR